MKNLIAILLLLLAIQVKGQYKSIAQGDYSEVYLKENSVKPDEFGLYLQGWVKTTAQEGKEEEFRNKEISSRKKLGLPISAYQNYSYTMFI